MNLKDIEQLLTIFLKNKTYAFIKISHFDREFFYNGYITETTKDSIIFKDDIKGEIPILKNKILFLDKSTRGENNG